jgi:hypothetical protein
MLPECQGRAGLLVQDPAEYLLLAGRPNGVCGSTKVQQKSEFNRSTANLRQVARVNEEQSASAQNRIEAKPQKAQRDIKPI